MEATKCERCDQVFFPPRDKCPKCGTSTGNDLALSGYGKLKAYTVIRDPPEHMELEAPYLMGIIELEEGPSITSVITGIDVDKAKVGMKVKRAFRRYGNRSKESVIMYGYKFIPEKHPKIEL